MISDVIASIRYPLLKLTTVLVFAVILEVIILYRISRSTEAPLEPLLPVKRITVTLEEDEAEEVNHADPSSEYIQDVQLNDSQDAGGDNIPCIKRVQIMGMPLNYGTIGEHFCPAENCSILCYYSMDYSKLKNADAVILYHKGDWTLEDLKRSIRPPRQILIYFSFTSAIYSQKWSSPKRGLGFNWTMTFQRDADIVFPYGRYVIDSSKIRKDFDRNWAENKTKLLAWMASNCEDTTWGRRAFVERLNDKIAVDTYGGCGRLKCPRDERCDVILSSYKFYLALENTLCSYYITEKFWENSFSHQAVPIVYGAPREDYERVAPPHSFIHLDDFSNMSALVQYIHYLDKNDSAYNEYFAWKRHGSIESFQISFKYEWLLCNILYKLRDFDRRNPISQIWKPETVDMEHWRKVSCGKQTVHI